MHKIWYEYLTSYDVQTSIFHTAGNSDLMLLAAEIWLAVGEYVFYVSEPY